MGTGAFTDFCSGRSDLSLCGKSNVYLINIIVSILQGGPGSSML
jgi:hypothetical protein